MGTRSRIGIQLKDSSVVSVYCHWDGYPAHNGKILTEEYTTREDVENLINGGSISSLKTRETWNSGSSLRRDDGSYITDEKGHMMYENDRIPQPLYHAELGEEINVEHTDFDTFVSGDLGGEEYAYLFTLDNTWKCYSTNLFQPTTPVEIP
jgi:hypothetical protein